METIASNYLSLEDALTNQPTYGKQIKTFVGVNIGFRTFTVSLPLFDIQEMTEVANDQSKLTTDIAQRKLDPEHAAAIAKYILKGLLSASKRKKAKHGLQISKSFEEIQNGLGTQPYLSIPPLVASLRDCQPNGTDIRVEPLLVGPSNETACFKVFLKPGATLWIVDGQHRRMGLQMAFDFLKHILATHRYPAKGSLYKGETKQDMQPEALAVWADCFAMLREVNVSVEVHLGLNIDQERQLFHDLNNLGRKVDKSLALNYDGSNPINKFIGDELLYSLFIDYGFRQANEKDKADWNAPGLTRQELVGVNALLFLNKTNINGAVPAVTDPKLEVVRKFWNMVMNIEAFTDDEAKLKTVAAQTVVLKALAKLTYDFTFGKNKDWVNDANALILKNGISEFDFSHSNPLWRYYEMTEVEREQFPGIKEYLPSEDEGVARFIGKYDENTGLFKFDLKHNDVFPIIGDMIRWKLGLPSRKRQPVDVVANINDLFATES